MLMLVLINWLLELMNMIIGIRAVHEHKSKMLFREFEKLLASNADAIAAEYPDH